MHPFPTALGTPLQRRRTVISALCQRETVFARSYSVTQTIRVSHTARHGSDTPAHPFFPTPQEETSGILQRQPTHRHRRWADLQGHPTALANEAAAPNTVVTDGTIAASHDVAEWTPLGGHGSSSPSLSAAAVRAQQSTRRQPLVSHRGQQHRYARTEGDTNLAGAAAYDPATVVRIDSQNKQLHLNAVQKDLVWRARQAQYQRMLERIVACLQSHLTPLERCHTLLALHDEVISKRLRLRVDTYNDLFHAFYAVGVRPNRSRQVRVMRPAAMPVVGDRDIEETILCTSVSGSLPEEFGTPDAAASYTLGAPTMERLWAMYRYMLDSGTNPSAGCHQNLMGLLEHAAIGNADRKIIEARAHSLLLDSDRFKLTPTEYTINAYVGVCSRCGVMHLAVARVADYQTRHERQASAGMYAKLITGLVRQGSHKEALRAVTTMQSVPMSAHLMNAVLQAVRSSPEPTATFTVYHALTMRRHGGTRHAVSAAPTLVTFSELLEALRIDLDRTHTAGASRPAPSAAHQAHLDTILDGMRRYRVKGNAQVLNRLLRIMLVCGREKDAASLARTMRQRGLQVFDEISPMLQDNP